MSRILAVVALAAAVALISVPAWAQCGAGPRTFGSIGGGGTAAKYRFDDTATDQAGNLGRFWDPNNSPSGNNWGTEVSGSPVNHPFKDPRSPSPIDGGTEGACQSDASGQNWWAVSQTTLRSFSGAISATGCAASACPAGDLTYLMEECGSSGCGAGGTAYFMSSTVTRFHPASTDGAREWDLAIPFGNVVGNNQLTLLEFPKADATASGKLGNDTSLTINIGRGGGVANDAGDNVHVDSSLAPTTLDSYALATVDILEHVGPADPGRERNLGCVAPNDANCAWQLAARIPYANAAIGGVQHVVDCGDRTEDVYVAIGLTFHGDGNPASITADDVESLLVGQAVLVQCDPQVADPEPIKPRPSARPADTRRTPTGRGR